MFVSSMYENLRNICMFYFINRAYGIEILKPKQDWKKSDEWDAQKDLQTSPEWDEQRALLAEQSHWHMWAWDDQGTEVTVGNRVAERFW